MSERPRPVVVRPSEIEPAAAAGTPGMERRPLHDDGDRWVGHVRTDAGLAGGWHHHGERDSYIYVIAGGVTIEYGPGGRESVRAGPGDFIYNPARIVHREVTDPGEPATFFVVRVGDGPQNVNVDAPDPD
jgi:uncharacterized RmlC-like cupin family protein